MATYYVAPDGQGDNGDTGGIGGPWSTLAYAVTQVSSSDVIYMQVGIHTIDTTVSVPIGVSLIGAGDTSIITTTNATEWNVTLNLISAEGTNGNQSISYLYFDGNLIGAWCINVTGRSNVWVHDCTFIDWDTYAIHFRGRTDNTANPPTIYSTGNKFYNNTATNSSRYRNGFGTGVLNIGGQTGMEIYNNTITSGSRTAGTNGWPIKDANAGCIKGLKIYDNTLINDDVTNWDFSIEFFYVWGIEVYNNNLTGCIDLNIVSKGDYEYGAYIHNNTIGPEIESSKYYHGVILEFSTSDVIIEYNRFRNCCDVIRWSPRVGTIIKNIRISYNIFENIGSDTFAWGAIRLWEDTELFSLENFNVYNNVFYCKSPFYEHGAWFGIGIGGFTTGTEINIINNIFIGFSAYWLSLGSCSNLTSLNIQNNIVWNNQNSNATSIVGTPGTYINSGNLIVNPDFTTPGSDFTLQAGSPAINAGLDVGLTTDYEGKYFNSTPSIGALEFGNIYYIDPAGSNSNNGSISSPWLTLAYACSQVTTPGDYIHVNAGSYTVTSGINLSVGVSIIGEGETSIIHSTFGGEFTHALWLTSAAVDTKGNQSISYIHLDGSNCVATAGIYIAARSNVKVHHCKFTDFAMTAVSFNGKVSAYDVATPTAWCVDNEFHHNDVDNCCQYVWNGNSMNYGSGALQIGIQQGMLVYDNNIQEDYKAYMHNGYCIKMYNEGYNVDLKIYNNTLIKASPGTDPWDWNFAIELWNYWGGIEIYNNTIYGGIDIAGFAIKNGKEYSASIHDNWMGYDTVQPYGYNSNGMVYIEHSAEGVLIYNNYAKNFGQPIQITQWAGDIFDDIYIYNNVFDGVGTTNNFNQQCVVMQEPITAQTVINRIHNFNFLNNTIYTNGSLAIDGVRFDSVGTATDINIRNNIFQGFATVSGNTGYPVRINLTGANSINNLSIENNIFYNNSSNSIYIPNNQPSNYTAQNNIVDNPDFTTPGSDFTLQPGSPAIGAGINVGLTTDYAGNLWNATPSIGAYEYGSNSGDLTLTEGTWLANRTTLNAMYDHLYQLAGL